MHFNMDYFPTDFESDSEQLFGMEFQRTTIRRQQEDNMHLSSSIQDFTTFDTSLMDEDDIPTRDAGLDLSYPVNVSGGGLPNEPDPDTSLRYLVDVGSSRISQSDQHSDSKKKRTKSKRRKEVERSKNNNSLNFREKLEQIERGEFCDEEVRPHECADLPVDRQPSCWERDNPFELIVTPQNVDMLLISARFYQQSQVVSICKDALVRCDVQDALYYRFVAEKHELADITPQLVDFVRANFTSITHTHSFLGLELNQLKALLSDDGLKVQSELDVFNAARAWIDHCKHLRIKRVGELMSCVRFNHISPEDIVRHVEPHKNYFRGPGGREVLLSIYRYHALHGSQGDLSAPQADMPPPRCYVPLGMAEPTGMASTLQFQQPVYSTSIAFSEPRTASCQPPFQQSSLISMKQSNVSQGSKQTPNQTFDQIRNGFMSSQNQYQGQDPLQADRGQVPQYVHAQDAENLATETQTRSQSESQHQMIRNSCEHGSVADPRQTSSLSRQTSNLSHTSRQTGLSNYVPPEGNEKCPTRFQQTSNLTSSSRQTGLSNSVTPEGNETYPARFQRQSLTQMNDSSTHSVRANDQRYTQYQQTADNLDSRQSNASTAIGQRDTNWLPFSTPPNIPSNESAMNSVQKSSVSRFVQQEKTLTPATQAGDQGLSSSIEIRQGNNAGFSSFNSQQPTDFPTPGESLKEREQSLGQYQYQSVSALGSGPAQLSQRTVTERQQSHSKQQQASSYITEVPFPIASLTSISSVPKGDNLVTHSSQTNGMKIPERPAEPSEPQRQNALSVSENQSQDTPSAANYNHISRPTYSGTQNPQSDLEIQSHTMPETHGQEPTVLLSEDTSSQQDLEHARVQQLTAEQHGNSRPSSQSIVEERRRCFEVLQTEGTVQQPVKTDFVQKRDSNRETITKHDEGTTMRDFPDAVQTNLTFAFSGAKSHCPCHCTCLSTLMGMSKQQSDTNECVCGSTMAQGLSEKQLDDIEKRLKQRKKEIKKKALDEYALESNIQHEPYPVEVQSTTSVRVHYCQSPHCSPVPSPHCHCAVVDENDCARTEEEVCVDKHASHCNPSNGQSFEERQPGGRKRNNKAIFRPVNADLSHVPVLSAAENPKAQNTHFPQQPNNQVHLQRHHAYNHKQKPKRHLAEQTQPPNQEKQQQNRQRLNRWSRQHDEQDPSLQHHLDRNYHNYERHEDPTEQHLQELLHQQAQNAENYQRSLHRLRNAGRSGAKPPQQPITNNNQQLVTHNKQQPLTHKQRPMTQNKQRPATPTHIKLQPVTHHKQQPAAHNKRKLASPVCQLHQHSSHVRSNPGQQYNKFCNKSCNMPHYERQILNQQQGIVPPGDAVVQQQQLCIKQSGQRWGQETAEKIQGQGYTRRRRSESPADGKAPIRSRLNRPKSQPPPCGRRAVCKGNYFNENATNIQGGGETGPVNQGYPVGKTTQEGAPQIMDPMMDQQQGTDDDILPVNESGTPPEPTPGTGLIFRRHPYNNHGSHKMPMYPDEALVVVTGGLNPHLLHSEIPCRLMNCYNPSTNTWTLMGKLPEARHHHGCVMLDGYLYVIGGSLVDENDLFNMSLATSTCYRYDFGGNFWTAVGPMRLARMYHAVTVLEGIIYAMGGETSKETAVDPEDCFLDSCEYYNPDTDEWGPIANMRDSIIGAAIIGFRGMVWLIGGFVERRRSRVLLATVECYDPRTNSWVSMNPLPAPLCHATVAEVMNTLFVVGGAMSQQPDMPLISVGDVLQYLEVEDVWVTFSSLTIPRHDVNCCAIDSHLFILGGVSSRLAEVLEDMECIDISTGEWQADLEPLTSPAMGLACVAVTPDSFDK